MGGRVEMPDAGSPPDLDSVKKVLEIKKLNAEIGELTKPWYRKSQYLAPGATILAALVVAFFAFFTDFLHSNIATLTQDRKNLTHQVQQLSDTAAKRKRDLDDLGVRLQALHGHITTLEAQRQALEQQVGELGKTAAYHELTASIFQSSTESARLLASRMRDALDPGTSAAKGPGVQGIYQSLQDNLNFVALARSLLSLFRAAPRVDPLSQDWRFSYSMLDARSYASLYDIRRTVRLLSLLQLLPPDGEARLLEQIKGERPFKYLWLTGQISIPLRDSPLLDHGRPRGKAAFVKAYRESLGAVLETSPIDMYRFDILRNDALWAQLEANGNVASFGQYFEGLSTAQVLVVGSDYTFIEWGSEALARISHGVYDSSQSIARGDVESYKHGLHELLASLQPLKKSPHHFDSGTPWLLLVFDSLLQKKITISGDFEATGLPRTLLPWRKLDK